MTKTPLRIAQVSPLFESVPPRDYGGTERVVSYLTEELVRAGHDVTLFASGDSRTAARLEAVVPQALWLDEHALADIPAHVLLLERLYEQLPDFHIVHFHIDYLHFSVMQRQATPHLTTQHGRLDSPGLTGLYQSCPDVPLNSISNAQRSPLPWLNWQGTVHHGIPEDLYHLDEHPGHSLTYIGRITPEKGLDTAIAIALKTGRPLTIAGRVNDTERSYFESVIKPLLHNRLITYIGQVNDQEKQDLLGTSAALLFPIDWPEPFGLVLIEAMACGTPVIACPLGAVPEIIDDGVTGFLVSSIDDAAKAVKKLGSLDRRMVRRTFEQRFTSARMCRDYLSLYGRLLGGSVDERAQKIEQVTR